MQLQLAWGLPLLDFKLSTVIPPEGHREPCTKARSLDLKKHPVGKNSNLECNTLN